MLTFNRLAFFVLLVSCLLLTACGGGGANIQSNQVTLGQELSDLQTAYHNGAITDDEYLKAKKLLFERYE